jgi:hypothetical protein
MKLPNETDRFIEIRLNGPLHVATPLERDYWLTCCRRIVRRASVCELTAREVDGDNPDTYVCRQCIRCLKSAVRSLA